MKPPSTSWLWTTATILVGAAVCLTTSLAEADWTYEYRDDFSSNKAEEDSYLHSVFWPQGAFPPLEPYLYYLDTREGRQRELALGDYNGQPAHLGYCFPVGKVLPRTAVRGNLQVDVRFRYGAEVASSLSGYLLYSLSADGVNWSTPQELQAASHDIPIESVRGTCYITFFGTEVLIDNLVVNLYSSAATIYVPRDFATIQRAIDAAADGDIVEVAPGTYRGDGNWDIDFRGKAITVRSNAGSERTIIDCAGQNHRGFYFHRAEGPSSVLRGFTIIGALVPGSAIPPDNMPWSSSPAHPVGGGIYCEFSSPSIVDCVIKQCAAALGGGIGSVGGAPAIIDCVIEQCQAGRPASAETGLPAAGGAGIGLIRGADATIIGCTIKNNSGLANSRGAGVYCWQSRVLLANCDIFFNPPTADQGNTKGGGIYCGGPSARAELAHCIISNNTADTGGGVFTASETSAFDVPNDNDNNSFDFAQDKDIALQAQAPRCYVSVTNCTIAHNKLSSTGGGQMTSRGGGIHSAGSDIAIRNSIVWYNDGKAVSLLAPVSNSPVLYSNIEAGFIGQGNINAPPLFASPPRPALGGDYHLKSFYGRYEPLYSEWVMDNEHSPCIDAGDPKDPVGAEPTPNGKRINMGAFGGTSQASKGAGPLLFHVDRANGNDSNTGRSRATAFATIQRAVDEAIDGDTVLVWPGVYREEVTFNRKAVTLQSADHAAQVSAPGGFAFSFYGAESSMSVLRNFVITACGEAAVFCDGASATLTNLTIARNRFGITAYGGANPTITNCILWDNERGDLFQCRARYSRVQQPNAIGQDTGNISTDPLFADPNNGDYHLRSRYGRYSPTDGAWMTDPVTSPCIDAGDPSVYYGREPMPHGGRVNMGAYGGTPFASKSGWPWP